jgi:hypothetical protein
MGGCSPWQQQQKRQQVVRTSAPLLAACSVVAAVTEIVSQIPTRHVECGDGIFFPFSRGCSFIKLDNEGRIVEVRNTEFASNLQEWRQGWVCRRVAGWVEQAGAEGEH